MKGYLIGAASSGSGKTTLTIGILRALSRRGIAVQPCKCGPDYIDTQYHKIACGKGSYNIDPWMGLEVAETVCHPLLVEGCMGLFDGAVGSRGSNAEIAGSLHLPVILVVNARSMAHSAAPLLYGYLHYKPVEYAGVIYNNVGSSRHEEMLSETAREVGMRVLGFIPRQRDIEMPSRHLGLDLLERERISVLADRVADLVEEHTDLLQLWSENTRKEEVQQEGECGNEGRTEAAATRIYVARDDAFSFLYQETIDRLREKGTVRYFSPLANEPVPEDADIVYLPGGYPELFLAQLAQSTQTMESLRRSRAKILAECGGMMYLGQEMDGTKTAGLLPICTTMKNAHLHLGYRQFCGAEGHILRGHEFHYSSIIEPEKCAIADKPFSDARGKATETLLFRSGRIVASYVHWSPRAILEILEQMGRAQ